jgi:hypothetical protein
MKSAPPQDLSASVKAKLLNIARRRSEQLQRVLVQYAIERFLYRLSRSAYADRFILKGAVLGSAWESGGYRPTRDLDLHGVGDSSPDSLADVFRRIALTASEPDGLAFDPASVIATPILEEAELPGTRVRLAAHLGKAKIPVQVDIGFGDPITPGPVTLEFPSMLGFPPPKLRGYPVETVVAEKFESLVRLGMRTGRIKDVYDLWYVATHFPFEARLLRTAIQATFRARRTALPTATPVSLSDEFETDPSKQGLWRGFAERAGITRPGSLSEALSIVRELLLSVGLEAPVELNGRWPPGGPWQDRGKA